MSVSFFPVASYFRTCRSGADILQYVVCITVMFIIRSNAFNRQALIMSLVVFVSEMRIESSGFRAG